jgi:sarcosine oxidase, subunit gamma
MGDMTTTMPRTHPLEAWSAAFASLPESVGITVQPFVATVDVRLGTVDSTTVELLGVDLQTVPNTWVPTDGSGRSGHDAPDQGGVRPVPDLAVWLGPDEWLLTSTAEAPEELEARVRAAVVPLGGSAANVSAQRIILRLTGERVRDVLAKGCAIDLHPRVFGCDRSGYDASTPRSARGGRPAPYQGSSAQTTLGRAGVVLLALGDAGDDYLVFVRSSFAGYLADWLLDAALEFTVER